MPSPRLLKKACAHCGREIQLLTLPGASAFCLHCGRQFKVLTEDFDLAPSRVPVRPPSNVETLVDSTARVSGAEFGADGTPVRLGEYRIVRELGRGGMARVYEAEQTTLRRRVALKVLPASLAGSESLRVRFRREAEAVARLDHPGIVKVYGIGEERGVLFFAMELVDGRDLDELSQRDRVSFERAAAIVGEAARALHYAHELGVIHRDVKPANLLLTPAGRVRVGDFGLARVEGTAGITVAGSSFGTPAYMSPEQAAGRAGEVDRRTDIWGLGATLYELLTGQKAFDGSSPEVVISHVLTAEPTPPRRVNPRIPVDLETICLRAMEKEPARRYPTADELADDLTRFINGEEIHARPAGLLFRGVRTLRRNKLLALVIAVALAVIALLASQLGGAQARRDVQDREAVAGYLRAATAKLAGAEEVRAEAHRVREDIERAEPAKRPAAWRKSRTQLNDLVGRAKDAIATATNLSQRALGILPDDPEARRVYLATLLALARIEADLEHYDGAAAYLKVLDRLDTARSFATEAATLQRLVDGRGEIVLASEPSGARVEVRAFLPELMSWTDPRPLGTTPIASMPIDMGSYLLSFMVEGRAPALVSLVVGRNASCRELVRLLRPEDIPAGMVYVPAGPYRSGNPDEGLVTRTTEPFLIDRCEVTCADYKKFLDTLEGMTRNMRLPHPSASSLAEQIYWQAPNLPRDMESLPVHGLSYEDAQAYAQWVGKRLPRVAEWEKAARGTDGRVFPWGGVFEEGRAACSDTPAPGRLGFYRVTEPEAGASPYGCLNMAGNVAEYLEDRLPPNYCVLVGGSADHGRGFIRTFDVFKSPMHEKNAWGGLRCVKDAPLR